MALSDQALPLALTVGGAALCIAEAVAPGAHFIVVGVALLLAGLIGLAVPALSGPLALAVLVGAIGAVTLYGYRRFDVYKGDSEATTKDSDDLLGAEGVVTETVTPTEGQVRLREGGFNPTYSARSVGGEIPEGTEVMVTDAGGGSVLTVESTGGIDGIDRELAAGRRARGERESESETETESEPE
jgi:membrane protein implicated in regulation of membrane protease activity